MRGAAALLLATLAAAAAPPGSWEPFTSRREPSPGGRHYAVLRARKGGAVSCELVRRRPGSAPLPPARDLPAAAAPSLPRPVLDRDPGDELLFSGDLPQPPFQVRVLDREPGIVLFERYGALGTGDALALLGGDGKVRWRLGLADLFPPEAIASFPRVEGDLWWFETWWVDEGRGAAVLVARGDRFAEVALADGRPRPSGPGVLRTRLLEGPEEERRDAWEIAARLLPEGTAEAGRRALGDRATRLAIRARAALALRRLGEDADAGAVFRAALERGEPPEARAFAARWIGEVLGAEALPVLRETLRGEADEAWRPALEALAGLGERAVPMLVGMLGERDQHLDYRGGAAHALGAIGSPAALPALWRAVGEFDRERDEFHFVPLSALGALEAIGPPDLRERLLGMLDRGTPIDGQVCLWFESRPGKDAVPALRKAAGRWGKFTWELRRAEAALRACGE
jgi:hypothetical protein